MQFVRVGIPFVRNCFFREILCYIYVKCRGDVKSGCTVGVGCGWIVGM